MTNQTRISENKPYQKFAQGIFIVKAKNSSFNSDFSGLPRRLPDQNGTIYATDKALKYCIRKYLHDKGEKVFVWRRYKDSSNPMNINENLIELFSLKEAFNKYCVEKKTKDEKRTEAAKEYIKEKIGDIDILKKLLSAIDNRLFGVTYAGATNISVTGCVQFSYGVNKMGENIYYNNDILSPYQDVKKSDAEQQTLGNETKTLEAHYVYDFIINPNNLIGDLEFINTEEQKNLLLTEEDIKTFKEAV